MGDWLVAVGIGVVLGLAQGILIAREANRRAPVVGGTPGQVLHYLACSGLASTLPFVIAGLIVGLRFVVLFGTAVGFLVVTFGLLVAYAAVERDVATVAVDYVAEIGAND
jgi:hypothetical protein